MKSLVISALAASLLSVALTPAIAADATPKKAVHKVVKKAKAPVAAAAATSAAAASGSDLAFNVSDATAVEWNCEMGRSLKIYKKDTDANHIAIMWQNRLNPMTRVATTTGADRFEDTKNGLLWIDIPSKGMLLDTKHGAQLANECIYSDNNIAKTKKG